MITTHDAELMGHTGAIHNEEERNLFEAYMRGHCWAVSEWNTTMGYYPVMQTQMLFEVWRDRAALSAQSINAQQDQPAFLITPKNGKPYTINRAPDSYELRECRIRPVDAQQEQPQGDKRPCTQEMRKAGQPSPRTCPRCGLGPCTLVAQQEQPAQWRTLLGLAGESPLTFKEVADAYKAKRLVLDDAFDQAGIALGIIHYEQQEQPPHPVAALAWRFRAFDIEEQAHSDVWQVTLDPTVMLYHERRSAIVEPLFPADAQQEQPAQQHAYICPNCDGRGVRDIAHGETEPCFVCNGAKVIDAQQEQPALRTDALEAKDDQDHQTAPAFIPVQYSVYDEDKKKVIQCHPYTESGERKVDKFCLMLMEGTVFKLKKITLYMKAEDL